MRWYRDDAWLNDARWQALAVDVEGLEPRWFHGAFGNAGGYPLVVLDTGGSTSLWPWLERRESPD